MNAQSAEQKARRDLAAAHRLAVMENLHEGTWNHFSLKHPERPEQIFLTPGNIHWSEVCASNLALMGPQREMVAGDIEPNFAAWIIHYPIHRARPDLQCLMHAHPPYATAMSMCEGLEFNDRSCQAATHFYRDIAYFDVYDGALREEEEGERMAAALGTRRVLVLRNHGVLVGGASVGHAWQSLYLFERACMFQMLAATVPNRPLNLIPSEIAAKEGEYAHHPVWEERFQNLKRVLDRREPSYLN
jgi:ribulose-5-phosphate 4-epimerase/fuculose-1-phosphate aldolase